MDSMRKTNEQRIIELNENISKTRSDVERLILEKERIFIECEE